MDREKLIARLNGVFQTYPSHAAYLGDEKSIRDFKADVLDGNRALSSLIDEIAHEL